MISGIIENIETGEYKYILSFSEYRNGNYKWKSVHVDPAVCSSKSKIIGLATLGIMVTEKTAVNLIEFLADLHRLNPDTIPLHKSISHLGWVAAIDKPDTSTAEYQAAVTNIFTKVQLLGRSLTPKLLKEILAPAVEKQDNSTIEAVRNFIFSISDFPGGELRKKELLESAPKVINQADLLDYAKEEVNRVFNDNNFLSDNMKSSITMNYLEQSGVFEL